MGDIETLTALPASFTAGDTLTISETLGDYAADSWTLVYECLNRDTGDRIKGLESSDGGSGVHSITAPADKTAQWVAGRYEVQKYVQRQSDGAVRTIGTTWLVVKGSARAKDVELDQARENVRVLKTVISEGYAGGGLNGGEVEVDGKRVDLMGDEELRAALGHWERRVRSLVDARRRLEGKGNSRKVLFRAVKS